MSSKEKYCFRVLRKYGLLVNFDGEPRTANVPEPVDDSDETLSQWIRRVLGPDVENVVIYKPENVGGNHKLTRLQNLVNAPHLQQVIREQAKAKNASAEVKKEKAVEKTERLFSNISVETIQDLLDEMGEALEPSVKDFFHRIVENSEDGIATEVLIKALMTRYNEVVRQYRQLNRPEIPV